MPGGPGPPDPAVRRSDGAPADESRMLTLAELLRDLDLGLLAGEAKLDAPVRWVHISELLDPDALALGRRAAAHHGHAARRAPSASASSSPAWPTTSSPGSAWAPGSPTPRCPTPLAEAAAERDFPRLRGALRGAVHRDHREGVHAAGQRAVRGAPAQSIAAHERLERIVLVRARARRRGRRAGHADRRRGAGVRRRAASCSPSARSAEPIGDGVVDVAAPRAARARAARGQRRGFAPDDPELGGRARSRCRSPPPGRPTRDGAPPQAWLVAVKDARRPDRVRPPDAAPGGHDRRARAAAPAGGRGHRAAAGGRRAVRARRGRAGRPSSSRAASSRSGSATAPRRSCSLRAPSRVARPSRRALGVAAARRGGRRRARRRARRAACCALLPGDAPRTSSSRSPSASPSALRAATRRPVARRRRPRRARGRGARAPSTRRAARWRPGRWRGDGARQRRRRRARRGAGAWPPTATSAPSSCCSRCRTTTRCGCSATRSSARSRAARATTAAS